MTTTTATGRYAKYQTPEEQGRMRRLAEALEYNADQVDALADQIEQWGETPSARGALGPIAKARECSDRLRSAIAGVYRGRTTDTRFWSMQRELDGVGYAMMHALGEFDREREGVLNEGGGAAMCRSNARVAASGLRVVASGHRVHAQIARGIANGDHVYFG